MIYIIGDLHLSNSTDKPMDVFGMNWEDHDKKIEEDWNLKVKEDDTVILAGDFSWAMYLEESLEDFKFLNRLPGRKIMLKGNHDYWWQTVSKMKDFLADNNIENVEFLYNNAIEVEDKIFVGTRGWIFNEDSVEDKKVIDREAIRLELSIKDAVKFGEESVRNREMIAIMHYPPISKHCMKNGGGYKSPFLDIMKQYGIQKCYYAHLHGPSHKEAIEGNIEGVEMKLISSDFTGFKLTEIY